VKKFVACGIQSSPSLEGPLILQWDLFIFDYEHAIIVLICGHFGGENEHYESRETQK
jgi:hypothetical protein